MTLDTPGLGPLVTALVPSMSRSLAEQFNVFRVMRHGTHEKQLSNVFAWLLDPRGTHGLGDAFQRIFVGRVNEQQGEPGRFPDHGYRVAQEVETTVHGACTHEVDGRSREGKDIADIVLSGERTRIVVENYWTSDGHSHCFHCYSGFGGAGMDDAAVVLLCARLDRSLLKDGWEHATVVTYEELIAALRDHIERSPSWSATHPEQLFFIRQMVQQFVEGVGSVGANESLAFIESMCATGESERYSFRPQDRAAEEFADAVAQHARRQFEDGRRTLGEIKRALKAYAESVLAPQLNAIAPEFMVTGVKANYQGMWEWCVILERADRAPLIYLEFGPTAVAEYKVCTGDIVEPDYSTVFVTRQAASGSGIDRNVATTVRLAEVLDGLPGDDARLRDAVREVAQSG